MTILARLSAFLTAAALAPVLALGSAQAQIPGTSPINVNQTPIQGGTSGKCLYDNSGKVGELDCGLATTITVGTTLIASGTTTRVLYDNAGVLGEYTISGSGSVCMTTSCTMVTPVLGAATGTSLILGAGSAITSTGPGGALVSTAFTAIGTSGATVPLLSTANTWTLAQTFTAAPVFSDASGTRTALGLGALATVTPGTGVATALAVNVGTAGAFVVNGGALGTPSSGTATNLSGTAASLTAGTVTTNANLTGDVTSSGNATTLASVATAGTTGSSTAIPVITINVKGLTTGISTAAVVAPAGTLSGATLAAGVTASSLTSLGTLTGLTVTNTATITGSGGSQALNITSTGNNGNAGVTLTKNGSGAAFVNSPSGQLYLTSVDNAIVFQTNNATQMTLGTTGSLTLPGLASSSAAQTGTVCWTTGTGNLTVDTTTTCLLSSARFKHDIRPLDARDSLATVMALRPVSYQYNDPAITGQQVGFIAEDVAELDDRLVSREPDGSPRAVRYQQLTADLAGAIQAQQKQIEELRGRRWCLVGWCL